MIVHVPRPTYVLRSSLASLCLRALNRSPNIHIPVVTEIFKISPERYPNPNFRPRTRRQIRWRHSCARDATRYTTLHYSRALHGVCKAQTCLFALYEVRDSANQTGTIGCCVGNDTALRIAAAIPTAIANDIHIRIFFVAYVTCGTSY